MRSQLGECVLNDAAVCIVCRCVRLMNTFFFFSELHKLCKEIISNLCTPEATDEVFSPFSI